MSKSLKMFGELPPLFENKLDIPGFVVFTTQRSGSTMICNDVTSIGALGAPGEHVLWAEGKLLNDGSEADLSAAAFVRQGQVGGSGCFGLKIMQNQLAQLSAWLSPPEHALECLEQGDVGIKRLVDEALPKFASFFPNCHFVALRRRDAFAQAYSRARASATGVFHKQVDGSVVRPPKHHSAAPKDDAIDTGRMLNELTRVIQERRRFEEVIVLSNLKMLDVFYEDASTSFPGYIDPILKFSGLEGALLSKAKRNTMKVVSGNEFRDAKLDFLRDLGIF